MPIPEDLSEVRQAVAGLLIRHEQAPPAPRGTGALQRLKELQQGALPARTTSTCARLPHVIVTLPGGTHIVLTRRSV